MAYTAADVRAKLIDRHGRKLRFLLDELDKRSVPFKVEKLIARDFDGGPTQIRVTNNANDTGTASDLALNAIREWAGNTLNANGNTFGLITREWAKNGDGKQDMPLSVGTTVDWAFLFSREASGRLNPQMYPLQSSVQTDVFNLVCWVFADIWRAVDPRIHSSVVWKDSSLGLHRIYWDSRPRDLEPGEVPDPVDPGHTPNRDDQTHHFGAYFWLGGSVGSHPAVVHPALAVTHDYANRDPLGRSDRGQVLNRGDYLLGFLGAEWGNAMRKKPGFMGDKIAADLRNGTNLSATWTEKPKAA